VRDIRHRLKIKPVGGAAPQDDEIEEIEQEDSAATFKCAYSQLAFTKPMKK